MSTPSITKEEITLMENKLNEIRETTNAEKIVELNHRLSMLKHSKVLLTQKLELVSKSIAEVNSKLDNLKYSTESLVPGMSMRFEDEEGLLINTILTTQSDKYDLIVTSDIREFYEIGHYSILGIPCDTVNELIYRVSSKYNWKLDGIDNGLRK